MTDNASRSGRTIWIVAVILTVVAGVVVPYGILGGAAQPGFAVPLFWLVFGFVVVALIAVGVSGWRN